MDDAMQSSAPAVETAAQPAPRSVAKSSILPRLATVLILVGILVLGVYFRMVGRNWDEDQHLHPDERFLTMVTSAVTPARSLGEYFDTANSPLNPYNKGFGSFVYGTLPLFIVRYIAEWGNNQSWLQALVGVKNTLVGYGEVTLLGRFLSGLFDLAALVLLFLIGRRLFDTRVGLLAAALGAFSVLNIQQSHFYTADTFANFFAILLFYFCVRTLQDGRWWDYLGVGISLGAAVGSRINLLTLTGVVVVVIGMRFWDAYRASRRVAEGGKASATADYSLPMIGAAIVLLATLATFRLIMPYAFQSPGASPLTWWSFNSQWTADMSNAQKMNRGDVDVPFGHQWTDRWILWFPFYNMVMFGLGVPLGLAAWAGWFVGLGQMLLAARRGIARALDDPKVRALLIPVLWIGITFFFHGTQWVKSIRYFLQMYPIMALMAAWFVFVVWDWATKRAQTSSRGRLWQGLAVVLAIVVIGGSFLYALGFTNIYTRPVTRVAASRWIYENMPTGATVQVNTADGQRLAQVPIPNHFTWASNGQQNITAFKAPADGTLAGVRMNYLSTPTKGGPPATLQVTVARDPAGQQVVAQGTASGDVSKYGTKGGPLDVTLPTGAALEAGKDYYLITRALQGAPIASRNSALANEHWDDGIPLRVDNKDGFSFYEGVEMTNYDEDEPAKLDKMVAKLDQADYVFMTSGRLSESIPRLPMRWPMTTRYYDLMLNNPEALGFKLVGEWTSYPTMGPLVINDDTSEEQFRVYDHPKVLIFEKQPSFNKDAVKRTLGDGINWGNIQRLWDKEATNVYNNARWQKIPLIGAIIANRLAPLPGTTPQGDAAAPAAPKTDLMLPRADWINQQLNGTWSSYFTLDSPLSWGIVSVIVWLLAIELLGLIFFPIGFAIFRGLSDRGWFSSKIAGLLVVSYGAWLIASVQRIIPFGRGLVAAMLVVLLIASALFVWRLRPGLREFVRERRSHLIAGEIVFLVLFFGFLLIRMGNPDLWHPAMGGEKPMDFAYFNAVIRTQFFPSYDPWFAGGELNYYYYGFVLGAVMVLMTGIVPSTAYNLMVPLFFALTGLGAFGVVYNLTARGGWGRSALQRRPGWAPVIFGAVGAAFVVVVGNLGEVKLLVDGYSQASGGGMESNIPGLSLIANTLNGMLKVLSGQASLGFRQEWWYWNASRAIPFPSGETVPITEFPFFTFLYGDLHAHMLTLPLTLLALAMCLNVVMREGGDWRLRVSNLGWPTVLVTWLFFGLVIGVLRPANTWDYPTYLAIGVGAFFLHAYRSYGLTLRTLGEGLWRSALLVALSTILWLPFIDNFATAFSAVEPWTGSHTVWWSYLMIHGLSLFVIATFIALQAWGWWVKHDTEPSARQLAYGVAIILAVLMVLAAFGNYTAFVIGLPLLIVGALMLLRRDTSPSTAFILLITAAGISLTLMVDLIVLKGDISRMNTVFKFYLQVWVLFGVAAAAALAWVWDALKRVSSVSRGVWQVVFALLVVGVALYPILASWGRINDRFDKTVGPTLDGMAYMQKAVYNDGPDGRPPATYPLKGDYDAIRWMEQNIQGTPVILEAQTPEYRWGSRVSIYTGFPTVVGWSWHQRQQRSALTTPVVEQRGDDVKAMFNTPDPRQALDLMRRYGVNYVYIGPTEKAYYQPAGIAKFQTMAQQGQLQQVYSTPDVTIYRVVGASNS
ncbi:MAG: DUF2298 domain-containing protein [Anaerolineae bacterium]